MKKLIWVALLGATFLSSHAQVRKIFLQASGLTCSMCSNAINKSLSSLEGVTAVRANIRTSSFEIALSEGSSVSFDQVRKRVEDAGFFVAGLEAIVLFSHTAVTNDSHVRVAGAVFHFLHVRDQELNGEFRIKVLDKGFVTAKEFKKGNAYTAMECYRTGVAGSCCSSYGLTPGERIYHVTLIDAP